MGSVYRDVDDIVHWYVRFTFQEYEKDPYGYTTKNPPTVAEFEAMFMKTLFPIQIPESLDL